MHVVVANAVVIIGAHPEDLRIVDCSNDMALPIAPFEFVESLDARDKGRAMPAQGAVEARSHRGTSSTLR